MINNFVIFGDSYSTHKEYVPEGYAYFYCDEGLPGDEPVTKMTAKQTWWGQLMENSDAKLILNDSWSGSTIGYTGYSGDCSRTSSFIYRYIRLFEAGFFACNKVDTVFVFGGTNDCWSGAPLGEEQYDNWQREDLFKVLPAVCYLMSRLKQDLPHARIIFIGNCDIGDTIIDCMEHAAKRLGAEFVRLHDIDKQAGHPSVTGMGQISKQILEQLK